MTFWGGITSRDLTKVNLVKDPTALYLNAPKDVYTGAYTARGSGGLLGIFGSGSSVVPVNSTNGWNRFEPHWSVTALNSPTTHGLNPFDFADASYPIPTCPEPSVGGYALGVYSNRGSANYQHQIDYGLRISDIFEPETSSYKNTDRVYTNGGKWKLTGWYCALPNSSSTYSATIGQNISSPSILLSSINTGTVEYQMQIWDSQYKVAMIDLPVYTITVNENWNAFSRSFTFSSDQKAILGSSAAEYLRLTLKGASNNNMRILFYNVSVVPDLS